MTVSSKTSHGAYLNGKWVDTGSELEVMNPANGQVFASVNTVDRGQVRCALTAAHDAFTTWRAVTAKERGAFVLGVADN